MHGRLIAVAVILACLGAPVAARQGNPYWVSTTGAATWVNCRSATPLTGTAACSLSTALTSAVAGNLVYLRAGTYTRDFRPGNSGTSGNPISWFAYPGDAPARVVMRNTTAPFTVSNYYYGYNVRFIDWLVVDGIDVQMPEGVIPFPQLRIFMISHGSSYNEIRNCVINGWGPNSQVADGDQNPGSGEPVEHNWIHHCSFQDSGILGSDPPGVDDIGGMQIGFPNHDDHSNNNTFSDNSFWCGGHHNLETFTKRNVILNNKFQLSGCIPNTTHYTPTYGPDTNGLWGNRNIQIYDGLAAEGMYNLVEGNQFGIAGPPGDDDGGDGFTLTAPKNIIRYNTIWGAQNNGFYFKVGFQSVSENNRVYNNTIYGSGRWNNTGGLFQGAGIRFGNPLSVGNVVANNIIYGQSGSAILNAAGTQTNNTFTTNQTTDPSFVRASYTFSEGSNLALQPSSTAINAGSPLTYTSATGTSTTTLTVDDALMFQDGTWGSILAGHQADTIAIGTVDNIVQIASIDYTTNTITLAGQRSWADNDPVWLYAGIDGTRVLYGSAPDIGAIEYGPVERTYIRGRSR